MADASTARPAVARGPLLVMRGVRKTYGGVVALDGVDLEVAAGEVHALVGENGAGKSTLMKTLSGAIQPNAGDMQLGGAAYAPTGPVAARQAGVAMIYQELNLALDLSVQQNVFLGREETARGVVRSDRMRPRVEEALSILGRPEIDPDARVRDLGPGARQCVEIARALVGEARLLVMDEPTSSLSSEETEALFQVVQRLRDRGVSIIFISHFLEEVQRIADRYTVLRDGRTVATGDVASASIEDIVEAMVGRRLDEVFPARGTHTPGEALLTLDHLAGAKLPRDASLTLHRGEILGVAGIVGAGRTELLRAIRGLDPVRSGTVRLAEAAGGLGLLSEDRKEEGLALRLPITTNLTLSRLDPYTRGGFVSDVAVSRASEAWVERLGVRCDNVHQPVGDLSGGNQQKVALARLLHEDVDVLLLDEPTRGVDVGSKVALYRLLVEVARSGKALLVVSSYLPELLGICDRIAVMHRGVLGPARPTSAWTQRDLMRAATLGEADTLEASA